MVRSRPHYQRHQWSQISTFVSLNHIRHHTYFKSSYVHIQVFYILHHHTIKLLLAFKSFLPRRPIVEREWKLVRCKLRNLASKTGSLQATQFGSENCFAASASISAANVTSLHPTLLRCNQQVLWHRMLLCCRQLNFDSESQIRCTQYNFGSESQFHCRTHNSVEKIINPLQNTQFGSDC